MLVVIITTLIFQAGLILYGGIVCGYITWISVKKSVKERFSHWGERDPARWL